MIEYSFLYIVILTIQYPLNSSHSRNQNGRLMQPTLISRMLLILFLLGYAFYSVLIISLSFLFFSFLFFSIAYLSHVVVAQSMSLENRERSDSVLCYTQGMTLSRLSLLISPTPPLSHFLSLPTSLLPLPSSPFPTSSRYLSVLFLFIYLFVVNQTTDHYVQKYGKFTANMKLHSCGG